MIAVLIIAAALCALFLFLVFPSLRRHAARGDMTGRYIAHRGLHGLAENMPENSLAAFRAAIERGYAIEIDIHLTADGEVVVFHDDDTVRVCGESHIIEDTTLAELKKLRLAGSEESIPTLQECLEVVNGQVPLLVEFKCMSKTCKALCEKANAMLSAYNGVYWVQSFYPFVLSWYRRHRKDVCRGQLSAGFYGEELHKRLLGCLVFNVLARPDFVSYKHEDAKHVCRKLCTYLGAFPVGWTFTTQEALDKCRSEFSTYIFEGFVPSGDD